MPESRKRFSTVFSSGWICILASLGRNEMLGGTEKLQRQRRLLSDDGLRFGWRRARFSRSRLRRARKSRRIAPKRSPMASIMPEVVSHFACGRQRRILLKSKANRILANDNGIRRGDEEPLENCLRLCWRNFLEREFNHAY